MCVSLCEHVHVHNMHVHVHVHVYMHVHVYEEVDGEHGVGSIGWYAKT